MTAAAVKSATATAHMRASATMESTSAMESATEPTPGMKTTARVEATEAAVESTNPMNSAMEPTESATNHDGRRPPGPIRIGGIVVWIVRIRRIISGKRIIRNDIRTRGRSRLGRGQWSFGGHGLRRVSWLGSCCTRFDDSPALLDHRTDYAIGDALVTQINNVLR